MNLQDTLAAAHDAILLRAGAISPNLAHPLAAAMAADKILPMLAERLGEHATRQHSPVQGRAFGAGLSTDDFKSTLSSAMRSVTVNRLASHAGHRAWCDLRVVPNFQSLGFPSVDTDFELEENPELREFGHEIAVVQDEGLTARVRAFGKNIYLSRQVIRNDDVMLIAGLFANAGAAAARLEAGLVYDILEANGNLGDGSPMFHTSFENIEANVLGETALGAAMGRLRTMQTPAGALADLDAAHLVVAPELELFALRLLHDAGIETIAVHASAWLAAGRWYLLASPVQAPVVALLHLKGGEKGVTVGPVTDRKMRDGVPLGARFDVGAVAVGRVGAVRGGV